MELRGKKLVILGGSEANCKFIAAAKELGIHTIVTDINESAPAKKMADEALPFSVFDVSNILDYCRKNQVDGVANFTNTFSQLTCKAICDELGLPGYGRQAEVVKLTEKNAFKQTCAMHGIDTIPSYTEKDVLDGHCNYPIYVKPDDNSGSRGISFCTCKAEAIKAILYAKDNSSNGHIVIEKSMEGHPDFTVTYYCINGVPYLNRLADRFLGSKEENLGQTCICTMAPSIYSDLFLKKYDTKFKAMLADLHIENGPCFFQGFVNGDKIHFYDPAVRFPGGGEYERSLKAISGIDYVKRSVIFAASGIMPELDKDLSTGYLLSGKKFIQMSVALNPGVIGSIRGIEEIQALPFVQSVSVLHKEGDIIENRSTSSRRFCDICILTENTIDSIREVLGQVQSYLFCADTDGKNMLAELTLPEQYRL